MASQIEGLSEAFQALQTALDRVKDLVGDSAGDAAETIDESTAETEQDEGSGDEITSSGPGASEDDVGKAAAVESIKRMIGG